MGACVAACEAIGPWGEIIVPILTTAYAAWKARQNRTLRTAKAELAQEVRVLKASLPAPPVVQHVYPVQMPSMPAGTPVPRPSMPDGTSVAFPPPSRVPAYDEGVLPRDEYGDAEVTPPRGRRR